MTPSWREGVSRRRVYSFAEIAARAIMRSQAESVRPRRSASAVNAVFCSGFKRIMTTSEWSSFGAEGAFFGAFFTM